MTIRTTKELRLRRGTTSEHGNFIGAPGEVTVDTDLNTIRVHDGVTPAGHLVRGTGTTIVAWNDVINKPTIPDAQIQSDWTQTNNTLKDFIKNKPDLSQLVSTTQLNTAQAGTLQTITTGLALKANIADLATVATSGSYADLTGKPSIPVVPTTVSSFANDAGYLTSIGAISYNDLSNKPSLFSGSYDDLTGAPLLFSGSYDDLSNTPTLFSGAYADLTGAPLLFSGSYADLIDQPIIPSIIGLATENYVGDAVANLVNSSPATLDTLNELATALGNDVNFSTTVATALGNRLRVDTDTQNLDATQQSNAITNLGLATVATSAMTRDLTWSVYSTEEDLPNATSVHGMFAHVHSTGHGYMAHAGNWIKLANYSNIPADISELSDTTSLLGSGNKLVNGNREVVLDANGNLTLPNGGYIYGGADAVSINGSDYAQLESSGNYIWVENGEAHIQIGNNDWKFGNDGLLTFPDDTVQSTAWTGSVAYSNVTGTPTILTSFSSLVNGTKTVTLSTGGTLTANLDSALGVQTSKTLTNNNIITADSEFFPNPGYVASVASFIPVLSQRNAEQIEVNLFVVNGSPTYTMLTSLPLGTAVSVTYTNFGPQTFTTVLSQQFTDQGQVDESNRPRLSGRIDGTIPAGAVAIISFNFTTYSTQSNTWQFGTDGDLVLPAGGDIKDSTGASVLGGGFSGVYADLTDKPTIPTSFSSLVNGAHTVSLGTDGDLVLPAGKTIRDTSGTDLLADPTAGDPAYKGFKAHYGRMWGNNDDPNGPINKIVIYKDTVTPSSTIDTSTNNDTFGVTGLTGSDVVAMLVVIGDEVSQTTTAELKTFAESIIDNVILDEGVEGDVNTASAMKSAFYNNFSTFSATLTDLKTGFEFFSVNNQFNISPTFTTGDGAGFSGISYNMDNDTLDLGSWGQGAPNTHEVNDVHVIPGNTIQDANGNFLLTPDNDVTVTITGVSGGAIQTYTVTGTLPRPQQVWPSNSIGDGGDDEYDTGNYIATNLESNIIYNSGAPIINSTAFGGGDYVVTYQNSIFGVFAVNPAIDSISTSGGSGFDGNGQADTGSLYGAADSGVNIGDFVFTGSTLTATDDDLYIKAVDDLWLDALQDDIHIRANDDVRIKVGYDFAADTAQQEWRFDTFGYISFPDGTTQSTAYTGSVDYSNINNTPTIPTSFSSLVNDTKTVSLGTDGVLTLPEGSTLGETLEIVTVTLDQFTDGGYPGTQVFTKVSDTLYQVLPSGPTMALVFGSWYLNVGPSTYYNSTDLVNWGNVAGSSPAPIGTLTTVARMSLTVDGNEWLFDDDGKLTLPSGGTISEGGGLTGAIRLTPAGGANANQALVIYPTAAGDGDHIHLTAGGGTTDLYLGSDSQYVKIENGGNVVIQAADGVDSGLWVFNKNGDLTLPQGGDIKDYLGASVLFSGDYDDLTSKPTLFDGAYSSLTGTPALFSGVYADLTGKPTLFDGDYNSLTSKPTYKEAVTTGTGPGGNNQADSLVLAGLNPTENIPSTYGGDLVLKGGFGGANNDLFGEVRIKSGTIGSNFEWHFTVDKKIKLPAGGSIVDSTGANVFVSLTTLKQVVADSTDFADFQSRIAGM